jgi:hypothetical protein
MEMLPRREMGTREREVFQRCLSRSNVFATELLGSDQFLSKPQFDRKSLYHRLLTVEMTIQWLIDDLLDQDGLSKEYPEYAAQVIADAKKWIGGHPVLEQRVAAQYPVKYASLIENGMETIVRLAVHRNALTDRLGISLDDRACSKRLLCLILDSFLRVFDPLVAWDDYFNFRRVNCGLALQALWTAMWLCDLRGLDSSEIERDADRYISLLLEHAVVGGLANDVIGYGKDLQEGVTTSIEVMKKSLSAGGRTESELAEEASRRVVRIHNKKLDDVLTSIRSRTRDVEECILFGCLLTAWSCRILHQEHAHIYHPGRLADALPPMDVD